MISNFAEHHRWHMGEYNSVKYIYWSSYDRLIKHGTVNDLNDDDITGLDDKTLTDSQGENIWFGSEYPKMSVGRLMHYLIDVYSTTGKLPDSVCTDENIPGVKDEDGTWHGDNYNRHLQYRPRQVCSNSFFTFVGCS